MGNEARCWLVDRRLDDGRVVTVTYATVDGTAVTTRQHALPSVGDGVAAAITVDPDALTPVDDPADRERYQAEVARVREQHDGDDRI